jgi:hypothetical protein
MMTFLQEAQTKDEEAAKKHAVSKHTPPPPRQQSVWKRKFRPLPEDKAVDLFADVIGDSFILLVAGGLILYEYVRAKGKPDINAEKIAELNEKLLELDSREKELEEAEKERQTRVETLEQAIEEMRKNTVKKKLLSLSA